MQKLNVQKNGIIFILLLTSVFSFKTHAQTTINLAERCDCEITKHTSEVTSGDISPAGETQGDILIDPSGDLFFWDGDSWETVNGDDNNVIDLSQNIGIGVNAIPSPVNEVYSTTNATLTKGVYLITPYTTGVFTYSTDYFCQIIMEAVSGTISNEGINKHFSGITGAGHSFSQTPFVLYVTSESASVRMKVWNPTGGTFSNTSGGISVFVRKLNLGVNQRKQLFKI